MTPFFFFFNFSDPNRPIISTPRITGSRNAVSLQGSRTAITLRGTKIPSDLDGEIDQ